MRGCDDYMYGRPVRACVTCAQYPFASTYITYSVGPGYLPLPPWPMRVACARGGLGADLGVITTGNVSDVKFHVSIAKAGRAGSSSRRRRSPAEMLGVAVDWNASTPSWGDNASLTEAAVRNSGVLELMAALSDAVGLWYNLTGSKKCYHLEYERDAPTIAPRTAMLRAAALRHGAHALPPRSTFPADASTDDDDDETHGEKARENEKGGSIAPSTSGGTLSSSTPPPCAACPPCDDCPPCPVATCAAGTCAYRGTLSKTFAWDTVTCDEDLNLYNLDVRVMHAPAASIQHRRVCVGPSHGLTRLSLALTPCSPDTTSPLTEITRMCVG